MPLTVTVPTKVCRGPEWLAATAGVLVPGNATCVKQCL